MTESEVIVDNALSRAPDLVLSARAEGGWLVRRLSERLSRWLGVDDVDACGRKPHELFTNVSPGLDYLAEEVLRNSEQLNAIAICFQDKGGRQFLVDVVSGGLGHEGERQVLFHFRMPPTGLAREHEPNSRFGLIGSSPGMQEVFRKITLYAATEASVVVTGETGSGKELVARALHEQGQRRDHAFVAVNCSAISAELLESELFGHEKGSFTGASRAHKGRFERADRGTIFLDEVGDMPESAQVKLLRVLEEGQLERVGSERSLAIDVRIVAATNVPLEKAVQQGRFRADLYHRLAVLRIHLPPLRQRTEDIPPLVDFFLSSFRRKYGRNVVRLTNEAMSLLQAYLWPGNVRELRNVLERVFIENQSDVVGARAFREWVLERQDFSPGDWGPDQLGENSNAMLMPYQLNSDRVLLSRPERLAIAAPEHVTSTGERHTTKPVDLSENAIRQAWSDAQGNLTAAARLLGVHRATLYRYLKKLNLSRKNLIS